MTASTPREIFLESVNRCVANEGFIAAFYDRFLRSSSDIRHRFRFTDFERQHRMLRRSLELCAGATAGEPEALQEIGERARTHSRAHLNIEPRLYTVWLETIVDTASDFDPDWSEGVEDAWRDILGHVIKHMIRHY